MAGCVGCIDGYVATIMRPRLDECNPEAYFLDITAFSMAKMFKPNATTGLVLPFYILCCGGTR